MSQMSIAKTATPEGGKDSMRIPTGVLLGAGALLLFTMGIAGTARLTGRNHVAMAPTYAVASRDLTFTDQNDGGVEVTDATSGRHVFTVVPTTGGFLRGIMRGLVREHRLNDLAAGSAFRLTRWADGRLSIEDPTTHERFELEAFGPTNEAVFAQLLVDGQPPSEAATSAGAQAVGARAVGVTAAGATTR